MTLCNCVQYTTYSWYGWYFYYILVCGRIKVKSVLSLKYQPVDIYILPCSLCVSELEILYNELEILYNYD